jgi:formylglycine-generating enzyme required for sulfatase activity
MMGTTPSRFKGEDLPVDNISWLDAVIYCNKRSEHEEFEPCYKIIGDQAVCDFSADGYRLPTEAEWEYAARGGQLSKNYKYSGSDNIDKAGWYEENSGNRMHQVGGKIPNELGLYDMSGNVSEYCWDYFYKDYYTQSPVLNPTGPRSGKARVIRVGAWNGSARKTTFRSGLWGLFNLVNSIGFRVVRNAD